MTDDEKKPVVVGVDGSVAAIEAAQWAVAEARARDVPLRLVSSANTHRTVGDSELKGPEVEYCRTSLREAAAAVAATDESVKVESELSWGPPGNALIAESQHAAMVCVGSVGIGAVARAVLGSTAADVAERAHCPVAIIRPRGDGSAIGNWVAVGLQNQPEDDVTLRSAFDEARVRHAPLVVVDLECNTLGRSSGQPIGLRVDHWRERYPDVDVDVIESRGGLAEFLADNRDELSRRYPSVSHPGGAVAAPSAVVAGTDVADVARIVGPHDHPLREHATCSVLVAR